MEREFASPRLEREPEGEIVSASWPNLTALLWRVKHGCYQSGVRMWLRPFRHRFFIAIVTHLRRLCVAGA